MEQIVGPARKIVGEAVVPGELRPAEQALVLAALAEGESRIRNAPPAIGRLVEVLRQLGVKVEPGEDGLVVQGGGLRGFRPPAGVLDLEGLGDTAVLILALLAGQSFATRVAIGDGQVRFRGFLEALAPMRIPVALEEEGVFSLGGPGKLVGAVCEKADLAPPLKLAVLLAGLYAEGRTSLHESLRDRDRTVTLLRQRQIDVERHRQEGGNHYLVVVEGGQVLKPAVVDIPGELVLALPLIAAALPLKGSELAIRRVAIHPGKRAFLDVMRHMGASIALQEAEDGTTHLEVRSGDLKATRIAEKRTEKVLEQIALLAVLATQAEGEFVIRDIEALRQGAFDYVAHLVELLRQLDAKVGEFPEGIIIEGGRPLQGSRIDTRGDPNLVLAFAVAGLLAEGEMVLVGTECLDGIYPGFFATLEALKEKRR